MVIRVYKQNVSSGNIGVNVAGANTTSSSFASLSNTFNSFANNMFNEAAKKAQKEGVQSAQEATISNILQINPKTGNPVAYQEEGIYGSIFTDAFNEIIAIVGYEVVGLHGESGPDLIKKLLEELLRHFCLTHV